VPRHAFVETSLQRFADEDTPLPIGEGQTISQPFVVALMVQALALHPGQRVLEIGTGSGYQTAILCELTASPGSTSGSTVYSVERLPVLAERAATNPGHPRLPPASARGRRRCWLARSRAVRRNHRLSSSPASPRPLWEQLAPNGRLILPVGTQEWINSCGLSASSTAAGRRTARKCALCPNDFTLFADPEAWAEA
jgi:protein-L-isoaspartate(D-aspartate) O-methyltransferase